VRRRISCPDRHAHHRGVARSPFWLERNWFVVGPRPGPSKSGAVWAAALDARRRHTKPHYQAGTGSRRADRISMGCHAGPGLISTALWAPTHEAQAVAAAGRKSARRAMQSTLCSSLIFSKRRKLADFHSESLAYSTKGSSLCKRRICGEVFNQSPQRIHRLSQSMRHCFACGGAGLLKECESRQEKVSVCNLDSAAANADFSDFAVFGFFGGGDDAAGALHFYSLLDDNFLAALGQAVFNEK